MSQQAPSVQAPAGTTGQTTQAQASQPPVIPPEIQQELNNIVSSMLTKAHELAFELATCECNQVSSCPVARKAREIVVQIKKLIALQRKLPR